MSFLRKLIKKGAWRKKKISKEEKCPPEAHLWKVPDERMQYSISRRRRWGWSLYKEQTIAPKSKGLSKKLGIKRGSRILVLAGCFGDWADALARDGNRVVYSDVSADMVRGIKESEKGKKFESVRVFEASQWPRKSMRYDWSFSFEPIPIPYRGLHLALMRSLLNRKGAKLVYGELFYDGAQKTGKDVEEIARLYGARYVKQVVKIEDVRGGEHEITVFTLKTNEEARRKAWIDVQVLKEVRRKRGTRRTTKINARRTFKK